MKSCWDIIINLQTINPGSISNKSIELADPTSSIVGYLKPADSASSMGGSEYLHKYSVPFGVLVCPLLLNKELHLIIF